MVWLTFCAVLLACNTITAVAVGDCGCTPDETCCQDDKDYVCCIDQTTWCVAKNASVNTFPARCCPQWTVGCDTGSVGCCDPARPWQRALDSSAGLSISTMPSRQPPLDQDVVNATGASSVYAMFTTQVKSDLQCLTVDPATGVISSLVLVSGPAADYFAKLYGESTRLFPFDPIRSKFFFVDIVQQFASSTSAITLYGVDPATGKSTAQTVRGATGFVMSFAYHQETSALVMAVGNRSSSTFQFYRVDLDTAAAVKIGTVTRGAGETSASYYGGYITEVGQDGSTVYRLGYLVVSQGTNPGIASTSITKDSSKWETTPSVPGEEFFYSLVRVNQTSSFLSLAPSTSLNHSFSIVQWAVGGTPKVLANLPNAHPGGVPRLGSLGYVGDVVHETTYAALVVEKHGGNGVRDKWEVVTVDINGGAATRAELSGKDFDLLGAETVSLSGIGLSA